MLTENFRYRVFVIRNTFSKNNFGEIDKQKEFYQNSKE